MDPTLKQRLVGTAVVIALAVVFVPMILDGPVEQPTVQRTTGVPLELPERPEPVVRTEPPPRTIPTQTPASTPAPTLAPVAEGFAVQLGAFSDRARAQVLADRVKAHGFNAFVQRVQVASGTMYRVRVGPLADHDEAVRLAERIQRVSGERAVVVSHP